MLLSDPAEHNSHLNQVQPTDAASTSVAWSVSLPERLLSARLTPFVVTAIFLASLCVWAMIDHSIPCFDAALHSLDSSAVKQWLCRPRSWTVDSLLNLLRLQPSYPAGVWFFNGAWKVLLGDSKWTEHVILGIDLIILCFSTWCLSYKLLSDRLKANLAVVFVNCSPIVLGLQHSPLVDLGLVAFYAAFLAALANWWHSTTWRNAAITAVLLGFFCLTKQIAILYAAPVLAVMAAILFAQKRFQPFTQLMSIGACAGLFLATWVLPNLSFLLNFAKVRSATSAYDKSQGLAVAVEYMNGIYQNFSPLMTVFMFAGLAKVKSHDYVRLWPLLVSAAASVGLVIAAAFSNGSTSPRFAAPLVVVLSILLGSGCAAFLRASLPLRVIACTLITLCLSQAFVLRFQEAPVQNSYKTPLPIYGQLGLHDSFFGMTLPYTAAGDPWKQEWLLEYIENEEMGRQVYLNTLVAANQFNEGTLNFIANAKKSPIHVVTWRGNKTTTTDSFDYSEDALRVMHWFVLKTGPQDQNFCDFVSRAKYAQLLQYISDPTGGFIEASRQKLPDGTDLVLYRNKAWMWRRGLSAVKPVNAGR